MRWIGLNCSGSKRRTLLQLLSAGLLVWNIIASVPLLDEGQTADSKISVVHVSFPIPHTVTHVTSDLGELVSNLTVHESLISGRYTVRGLHASRSDCYIVPQPGAFVPSLSVLSLLQIDLPPPALV